MTQHYKTAIETATRMAIAVQAMATLRRISVGVGTCRHGSVRSLATAVAVDRRIAVLGGGISGLATAYFLRQELPPTSRITLYEQSPRLGGWVSTKRVPHPIAAATTESGDGAVVFEEGPRSLRPAGLPGLSALDLAHSLGLGSELLLVPKTSPSAKNRYIYYAGAVQRLPSSLAGFLRFLFSNPVLKGASRDLVREPFRKRPPGLTDESIRSFVSRRLSPPMADNLVSAVILGIYAGDIDKLSIRSTLPILWDMESAAGSLTKAALRGVSRKSLMPPEDAALLDELEAKRPELAETVKGTSIYSFKGGLQRFTEALEEKLRAADGVELRAGTPIDSVRRSDGVLAVRSGERSETYDAVVSALPATRLAALLDASTAPIPSELRSMESATVMVVNLHYDDPSILALQGFGYLIPRSVPVSENPDRALGVVFDSSSVPGQDTSPGTKLTCIMGGCLWSDRTEYPSSEACIAATRRLLHAHLGIPLDVAPTHANATLQRDCIPQYTVGHGARMRALHEALSAKSAERGWHGLSVTGASYNGVSVNDCILNARKLARRIANAQNGNVTGLESFADWQ